MFTSSHRPCGTVGFANKFKIGESWADRVVTDRWFLWEVARAPLGVLLQHEHTDRSRLQLELLRNERGVALGSGTCPGPAGAACAQADMFFQHGSNMIVDCAMGCAVADLELTGAEREHLVCPLHTSCKSSVTTAINQVSLRATGYFLMCFSHQATVA